MKETIEQIAKAIERHRNLEITISAQNIAIARSFGLYANKPTQFWIINKENKGGVQFNEDITGAKIGTTVGNRTTITEDGFPIYKNTKLGEILIENNEGIHINRTPSGNIDFEILNRATYKPNIQELAIELSIQLADDLKPNYYSSLHDILVKIKDLTEELDKLNKEKEEAEEKFVDELLTRISKKEKERDDALKKAQNFVRKNAELRYQPILDPIQEKVKRSLIFSGTLAIDGGPGTGKTTALIQRIKFLTSTSITDYIDLSDIQKNKLFNQKKSWIFFSPSELLALYLKNSMVEEGLEASSDKVRVWDEYKTDLIKSYKLVNTEKKRPFLFDNKNIDKELFSSDGTIISDILKAFSEFYIDYKKSVINKIIEINTDNFIWKNLGKSIQNYLKNSTTSYSYETLIRLFLNLSENYQNEVKEHSEKYSKIINEFAAKLQFEITKDEKKIRELEELLKEWKSNDIDIDDEEDIENENFEELDNLSEFDLEKALFLKIKSLARKYALKKFDNTVKFSQRDKRLTELMPEIQENDQYSEIGQLAYFKKYFEQLTKGIIHNIFREIPMLYKKFRRSLLNSNMIADKKLLEELVSKDTNKRLHKSEQSLLLYFINSRIKEVYKISRNVFDETNTPYFNAFKNHSKPIIGVDEATDFHILDLLAMHSLGDADISSVTFSGDLMQRMTTWGIKKWNELDVLINNFHVKQLHISYRQSNTLLNVASSIYEIATKQKPSYSSYMEKYESEPKPLLLKYENEREAIDWIADRIHEIYKAYGDMIPSIAIFLPSENEIDRFTKELGHTNQLADVGIYVKASRNGEVLGDKNTVRVFSIDYIKGLEFEAVFFHGLNRTNQVFNQTDSILKHLYVGLSRATLYLAATINEELTNELELLNELFEKEELNWKI